MVLRIEYDGAVYHVTSRGNARKAVYRDDEDRELFLDVLYRANRKFNWICHAYCLMNNHYHLVIETPDGNLCCGRRSKGTDFIGVGFFMELMKTQYRVEHLASGRAVLSGKDSFQSRYA
jgi:putative transposase